MRAIVVSTAIVFASQASSFTPSTPCNIRSPTKLFDFMKGEAVDAGTFDANSGGVGLAKRSAIKIVGVSKKGKGTDPQELVRYERLQELDMSVAQAIMEKADCQLLCSGTGKELYQDPGSSNRYGDKVVKLAPIEAATVALASMASAVTIGEDTKSVVVNFLGGDDLIIEEVLAACDMLVEGFDFPDKTKFKFNSLCFTDIPADVCSVSVVASGGKTGGLDGVDESVARGELYVLDGKWFTVAEGDISTATE